MTFGYKLLSLYLPLIAGTGCGWLLAGVTSPRFIHWLGQSLYWVGVPISVFAFLRQADLSGSIWIAPLAAWIAILISLILAWLWIRNQVSRISSQSSQPANSACFLPDSDHPKHNHWSSATQGSFLLTTMVGNTGYLGYPVVLSLVGSQYFGWAIFYDLLGTMLAAYGLGVVLAAQFGSAEGIGQTTKALFYNPTLWSFGLGLLLHEAVFPILVDRVLNSLAWSAIAFSLILIGIRLRQMSSWQHLSKASISLSIKMLIVPLGLGLALQSFALDPAAELVIILESAMPPAFATLVISEAFELDQELTVTTIVTGTIGLLGMLPLWLWWFG
ncbi:MAG: AEC family transporter [Thainema sp.]